MTDNWDNVPALVNGMPVPVEFKREMLARINESYYALLKERGEVYTPEDTFAMQRRLGGTRDQFQGYLDAFKAATALLKDLMEEELVLAVGEQDGIPNQGLTIPDAEGDIRISLDTPKSYTIDMDQVMAIVTARAQDMDGGTLSRQELVAFAIQFAVDAVRSLGKFEAQVSKVRAYAATLARNGRDKDASVVSGAISESTPYKGVRFERKAP